MSLGVGFCSFPRFSASIIADKCEERTLARMPSRFQLKDVQFNIEYLSTWMRCGDGPMMRRNRCTGSATAAAGIAFNAESGERARAAKCAATHKEPESRASVANKLQSQVTLEQITKLINNRRIINSFARSNSAFFFHFPRVCEARKCGAAAERATNESIHHRKANNSEVSPTNSQN